MFKHELRVSLDWGCWPFICAALRTLALVRGRCAGLGKELFVL